MLQVSGGRSVGSVDSSLAMLRVDYVGKSPDVTVQGWQKGGLNSEPSMISDLDEKVLPLYRQGPPIRFLSKLKIYDASVTGAAEQAGISLQR
jgi:hypothetical protein